MLMSALTYCFCCCIEMCLHALQSSPVKSMCLWMNKPIVTSVVPLQPAVSSHGTLELQFTIQSSVVVLSSVIYGSWLLHIARKCR